DVRIRGFRFRASDKGQAGKFILVESASAGVVLEQLDLQGNDIVFGVMLQELKDVEGKPPVVGRNCTLKGVYNGIVIVGKTGPCQGMVLSDNRFSGLNGSGILMRGTVGRVLVA